MSSGITDIAGIGPAAANTLAEHGIRTLKALSNASVDKVAAVPGFSTARAQKVIAAAAELLGGSAASQEEPAAATAGDSGQKAKKEKNKDKKKKKKKDKKKKKGKGK